MDSTGAAIADAEVTAAAASRTLAARSSADGTFDLGEIPPPVTLSVRSNGFATAKVQWHGEPFLRISMVLAQVQQDLLVTATRIEASSADVAASVSSLEASKIAASPSLQLDDFLRQVPGFSLFRRTGSRTANPTSQGVSLRGLGASGASRALVLFDGVPLNDPFGGWVYWDRVPITDIGELEVLRGGGSALYGSGALAGVVNVARRGALAPAVALDVSAGEQGTANGSASVTQRIGEWGLSASAQAMRTDGYIPVPDFLRGAVDAPANVRYGTGRVFIDRRFSSTTVFASGNLFNESRQNGTVLQANSTRFAEGLLGADTAALDGTLSLRAYLSGQRYNQSFSAIAADRNSETLTRVQGVPAQQVGLSALWSRHFGPANTFAVGADLRRVTGHSREALGTSTAPTGVVDSGGRQLYFGAFLEDMLRLGSRLRITAATRVDAWRNYDAISRSTTFATGASSATAFSDQARAAFSPSLGAVVRLNDMVSLTATAYGAFRSPTLNELYRAFRLGNVLTLANDALRPERLRGAEGGVSIGTSPLTIRATYFWNTIHDAVGNRTLSTTPSLITRQRQNIGDIVSRGVELEAQTRLRRHVWTRTAYEYSNSVVSRSLEVSLLELRVPQVPHHAVSQTIGYEGPRFAATILGRYVGAQFEDDLNQFILPGYFTADTMFRLRLGKGIEPYIAAENLLDRYYVVGRTPTPTLGSPRLVRGGVRFTLGR